jgi:hypothetical protein
VYDRLERRDVERHRGERRQREHVPGRGPHRKRHGFQPGDLLLEEHRGSVRGCEHRHRDVQLGSALRRHQDPRMRRPRHERPRWMSHRLPRERRYWPTQATLRRTNWTIEARATVLNEAGGANRLPLPCGRRPSRSALAGGHGRPVPCARRRRSARRSPGLDVDEEGQGRWSSHGSSAGARARIDHGPHVRDRILDAGIEAYVFTFG